jgi:hypothetical protein
MHFVIQVAGGNVHAAPVAYILYGCWPVKCPAMEHDNNNIFALFRVHDLHLHLFKVGSKQPSGAASLAKFVVVNWAIFSNGESATVLALCGCKGRITPFWARSPMVCSKSLIFWYVHDFGHIRVDKVCRSTLIDYVAIQKLKYLWNSFFILPILHLIPAWFLFL